jgi:hypothetical protein
VVMITPHIVRRDSPGVTPNVPALPEPFMSDGGKRIPPPPPAFTTPVADLQTIPAPVASATAPRNVTSSAAVADPDPWTDAQAPQPVTADRKTAQKADQAQREQLTAAARQADQQRGRDAEQARTAGLAEARRADQQKKSDAEQARIAALADARLSEQQKKQDAELARVEQDRSRVAAKIEAEQTAKDQQELTLARKADYDRFQVEHKLAIKKAAEQAAIDRKRWTEQQAEAARLKEQSDKLAKEQERQSQAQEKLAQEQAARQAEQSRLIEQYNKLTSTAQ